MSEGIFRTTPDGTDVILQSEWSRTTQNPHDCDMYPKTGQTVHLHAHNLLPDGDYLVTMVEEFEPAFWKDRNGRDIRISVLPIVSGVGRNLNGESFIKAMVTE